MLLMPFILAASALAAIPVVIHLFRRQQVTPIAWGAMQFLLETPLKARRRRRIDNLLLMLVRIAILLCIVAVLARPTVKSSRLVSSTALDVAIVLDHSLTMGKRAAVARAGGGGGAGAGGGGGGEATQGTLFDVAIATTERLVRMLPASATLSVVVAEHHPQILTAAPIKLGATERSASGEPRGDWARTLTLLRQYKPGTSRANIPAAVTAARELVSHGYNARKLILVLSDDQRSNWYPGDDAAWKLASGSSGTADDRTGGGGVALYSLPVIAAQTAATAPNLSVRSISVQPSFLGINRRSYVQVTVANTGTTDASNVPLQLFLDGRQVSTQALATLPAGQSQTVRIDTWFPEAGAHWVKVRADVVDSLDADNEATAAVQVSPRLPVLIIDGQLTAAPGPVAFPQAVFLQSAIDSVDPALEPTPFIELRTVNVAQMTSQGGAPVRLDAYPVVILNDVPRLPKELLDRLTEHALRGNGIWIILGPRSEPDFLQALGRTPLASFTAASPVQASQIAPAGPGEGGGGVGGGGGAENPPATAPAIVSVDIRDPNHPILQLWSAVDQRNPLAGVTLRTWWPITPTSPQLRTILSTTSGDPLILEQEVGKTGGRLLLWSSPAGNLEWNNLPLVPNFTPLINESLFHLASSGARGGGGGGAQPRHLEAGQPLLWTGPASQPIDSATLITPSGARRTLQPQLRGDTYVVGDRETFDPGLYELRFAAPPLTGATAPPAAYFSVNIDRAELEPTPLGAADYDWFKRRGYLKSILSQESVVEALGAQPGGVEVWWLLGILLFALLLVEVVMTRNLARLQSGQGLEEAGLEGVVPTGGAR
jgi:hypothetical protein